MGNIFSTDRRWYQWALFLMAAIAFGALMAFRDEIENIWLRAAVAAVAFGGFVTVFQSLSQRSKPTIP